MGLVLMATSGWTDAAQSPGPAALRGSVCDPGNSLCEDVLSKVVGIRASRSEPVLQFKGRRKITAEITHSEGTGSGILVDPSGLVLTCAHVIGDAPVVRVFLADDRVVSGDVVQADPTSDLALVRLNAGSLPAFDPGVVAPLREGMTVYLASRPGGSGRFFVPGRAAATGLFHAGHSALEFFREFTGEIEPGDSGAALVDGEGRLVGLVSVGIADGRGGFAIAREFLRIALARLRGAKPIVWPWLGIAVESPPDGAGARVWSVAIGSSAERAGVRAGDRIVTIDGHRIESFPVAMLAVVSRPVGSRFELGIVGTPARAGATGSSDSPRPVTLLSTLRSLEPSFPPLELFERLTGIRLAPEKAEGGGAPSLRVVAIAPRTEVPDSPRTYAVGSRLVEIVPGLRFVRALEEGIADQEIRTDTIEQLGEALSASSLGESFDAILVWETEGRRGTTLVAGTARRYAIL